MTDFVTIHDVILNPSQIVYIHLDKGDPTKSTVLFVNGSTMTFEGPESLELWKHFSDDKGWKDSD